MENPEAGIVILGVKGPVMAITGAYAKDETFPGCKIPKKPIGGKAGESSIVMWSSSTGMETRKPFSI